MHDLVAACAEECRAENLLAVGVGDDLHEPLGLAALHGSAHLCHRTCTDQNIAAGFPRFRFRHAGPAERRVDIESVCGLAVAHAAIVAVEQVCRNDLEIVVGGMGESAFAVAIAERVDVWLACAQVVIDGDVAARIDRDAGLVQPKIVRVRPPSDG